MRKFTPNLSIFIIVIVLIISGIGLILGRNNPQNFSKDSTLAASAEKSGEIGEYYTGSEVSKSASGSATPLPKPKNITFYTYPNSVVKSTSVNKLELESTESAQEVTDWYKTKISESNFNAKSFSQANTNGDVFNKLTAVKPGEKLDITIKKDQTGSKVLITVDRS